MFHHIRRIRDGLAVAVLVTAMLGAGAPAALGAGPQWLLSDKGSGPSTARVVHTAPTGAVADRPWARMLPSAR